MSFMDTLRTREALKQLPIPVTFVGASTSSAIDVGNSVARGLAVEVPVGWSAANIGIQVSREGTAWHNLKDQYGAVVRITGIAVNAADTYITPPEAWGIMRYRFVRLASLNTTTGLGVNQTNTCFVSVLT